MGLPPLKQGYTLEDWQSWEGRWELIDGIAYDMTPSPGIAHQRLSSQVHLQIGNAIQAGKRRKGKGHCEVFHAPTDLFLNGSVFIPDLMVVCDPSIITARGVEGPPDLVVEILSPSTMSKDYTRKRWAYEAAGVPEYLILDPEERLAVLYRLEAGRYVETLRAEFNSSIQVLADQVSLVLGLDGAQG